MEAEGGGGGGGQVWLQFEMLLDFPFLGAPGLGKHSVCFSFFLPFF